MAVNFFGKFFILHNKNLRDIRLPGRHASMFIPFSRLRGMESGGVASDGLASSEESRAGVKHG